MIKFYNTLTRRIDEFVPLNPPEVKMYSCGPTVYWNQHIGNMYAYVHWDVLVRFLQFQGFKVKWVMNITDVGHMTSDEDFGEDKMEKGAKREGLSVWEIAEKYTHQFLESFDLLNIRRPDVLPRATEHIQEQINLIKKIEENGFTYKTRTGLVFDTSKFPDYAKFGRLNLKAQEAGSRVEVDPDKKKPWDFLLWVTNQPTHIMQWDSPWGKGFPGWHIECTAISTKYLGEQFDIHTGGKEHIPVHHTNEVAQAYSAFGRQTANFWLHNEWLTINQEKVSKSLGNTLLVTDIIKKGYKPMHLRYLFLGSHYRTGLNFTWESLDAARTAYEKLAQLLTGWNKERKGERTTLFTEDLGKIDKAREKFILALSTDLNLPEALAVVWEVSKSNLPDPDKLDLILGFDEVLGLRLATQTKVLVAIPKGIEALAKKREELRKKGEWQEADKLRKRIEGAGFIMEDTAAGPKLKKKDQFY